MLVPYGGQLATMRHDLEMAMQVAMSRPQEWFTIIGRSLNHGEGELIERARLIRQAEETHAAELATGAMRAAEELESQQQSNRRRS